MIDLSWLELLFCAVLALIVIGPKDMPPVFRAAGRLMTRCRKMYNNVLGGVKQLEREIDITSGAGTGDKAWQEMLPEEVRNLPADYLPGSGSAASHQQRARETRETRERWHAEQERSDTA